MKIHGWHKKEKNMGGVDVPEDFDWIIGWKGTIWALSSVSWASKAAPGRSGSKRPGVLSEPSPASEPRRLGDLGRPCLRDITSTAVDQVSQSCFGHLAVGQNLVPLVNIKIAGKWMFIPLKMVLIGIDS